MLTGELLKPAIKNKLAPCGGACGAVCLPRGWPALLLAVALVLVSLATDYLLHLELPLRAALTVASLAAIAFAAWRQMLRPLAVPMSPRDLAMLVEKHYGELGDRLVSSLLFTGRSDELAKAGMSKAMIDATALRANELAERLDFSKVVERPTMKRMLSLASCAMVLLGGFSIWQQDTMKCWFLRNVAFRDIDWPQNTYLRIDGGPNFAVMRGDEPDGDDPRGARKPDAQGRHAPRGLPRPGQDG